MQFVVIGLGVFGRTCAVELQNQGNEVLGIDLDEDEVNKVRDVLNHVAIADATAKEVLTELNVPQYDGVLVSIGDDLEASLLCTLNLINLSVKNLWVKAKTDAHHAILERLGVTNIIHPEQDMGIRIAQSMNYPMVKQYLALGDDQFMVRIDVPKDGLARSVAQVQPKHADTSLLFIIRQGKPIYEFNDDMMLQHGDRLVYIGKDKNLKIIAKRFASD